MKIIQRDKFDDITMGSYFRIGLLGFVGLCALIALSGSVVLVGAGERGVLTTWGKVEDNALGEGIHVKTPFAQRVVKMDVQTQKSEISAVSFSKDIQTTTALIALNYHLDPSQVNKLYQEIGRDYEDRIISPAVQESVKQATANFTAQELIEKRSEVKEQIKAHLTERLARSYIVVDEFSIANFDFTTEYEKAVEEKQVAGQKALQAENDLRRIEVEAKQEIEKAKAEAESIRIRAEALQNNQQLVELNAIEKWDGKLPQYMTGATPFVNLQK